MMNENIQFRRLTLDELKTIKGAGSNPRFIGPPVEEGDTPKETDQNFFTKLAALFSFDFSSFFGAKD